MGLPSTIKREACMTTSLLEYLKGSGGAPVYPVLGLRCYITKIISVGRRHTPHQLEGDFQVCFFTMKISAWRPLLKYAPFLTDFKRSF